MIPDSSVYSQCHLAGGCIGVVGAAGDIGAEIARLAHQRGATVELMDLPGPGLSRIADELGVLGRPLDLRREQDVENVLTDIARLRPLSGIVNVAGVNRRTALLDLQSGEWDEILDINLRGTFLGSRAAARAMVEAGVRGVIVNVSSIAAERPLPGIAAYVTSKAAVEGLTRSSALELAEHGIRVNSVAPGLIETQLTAHTLADPETRAARLAPIPLGRFGMPRDIAEAVCFLLSPAAAFVTGTTFVVDGGQMLT